MVGVHEEGGMAGNWTGEVAGGWGEWGHIMQDLNQEFRLSISSVMGRYIVQSSSEDQSQQDVCMCMCVCVYGWGGFFK